MSDKPISFIRLPEVRRRTGYSAMTIWRGEKAGTFPKHVALGPNAIAWVEEEIQGWCEAKIKERDANKDASQSAASQSVLGEDE